MKGGEDMEIIITGIEINELDNQFCIRYHLTEEGDIGCGIYTG